MRVLEKVRQKYAGKSIPKPSEMTKEDLQEYLDAICQKNGFDYAQYLGEYKGEKIWKPSFSGNIDVYFGRPCFLHVSPSKVRRSKNYREASKVLNFFYPD